jgi:hypothetical protein
VWRIGQGVFENGPRLNALGTVANSVEKVHLQYLKRIIGVKKSTASSHVRGNLGGTLW